MSIDEDYFLFEANSRMQTIFDFTIDDIFATYCYAFQAKDVNGNFAELTTYEITPRRMVSQSETDKQERTDNIEEVIRDTNKEIGVVSEGAKKETIIKAGDIVLAERLAGQILLRVDDGGAIGYVDPKTLAVFDVTWNNARELFESMALGINENDHSQVRMSGSTEPINALTERLKGYLLLQVENHGAITYVDMDGYGHIVTFDNLIPLFESVALGINGDDYARLPRHISVVE